MTTAVAPTIRARRAAPRCPVVSLKRVMYTCVLLSWVLIEHQQHVRAVGATQVDGRSASAGGGLEQYRNLDQEYRQEKRQQQEKMNDGKNKEEVKDGHKDDDDDDDDVILISLVDGTMAGLSRKTGEALWKQRPGGKHEHGQDSHGDFQQEPGQGYKDQHNNMRPHSSKPSSSKKNGHRSSSSTTNNNADGGKILRKPLVSTTTTTKSSSSNKSGQAWRTSAVPSVDGRVYLTTSGSTNNEITATTTVRELVARAPFVDARGRFYVGSRNSVAVAVDRNTGDTLRVVSADENNYDPTVGALKELDGHNVVWMGRIDFSVSIYDARTGEVDVDFSTSEIMSVNDMLSGYNAEGGGSETTPADHDNTAQHAPRLMLPNGIESTSTGTTTTATGYTSGSSSSSSVHNKASLLVATPNGVVALRNPNTRQIMWVANETFDTPVAFAIEASTGISLGVDILPDSPVPSSSMEYLSRELERQIEALESESGTGSGGSSVEEDSNNNGEQTIVGALSSGQLFAMPLGRRHTSLSSAGYTGSSDSNPFQPQQQPQIGLPHPHLTKAWSSSSSTNGFTTQMTKLPNTIKRQPSQHLLDGNQNSIEQKIVSAGSRKACIPSSPTYPACLVGGIHKEDNFLRPSGESFLEQQQEYKQQQQQHVRPNHENVVTFQYHPEYGYLPAPEQVFTPQQPPQQTSIFRILASWLPPTMALIFVLSFELGRRKKLMDEMKRKEIVRQEKMDSSGEVWLKRENSRLPLTYTNDSMQQIGVIQVSEEVLGFGGHGTVVYKGLLDGRKVAVKRMLKAYHASADREISLLIESDGHRNVVRYFLKEVRGDFVYLALELCDMSLHDLILTLAARNANSGTVANTEPSISPAVRRTLFQIASGVRHLHSLRIVHRDMKPANILLAQSNGSQGKINTSATSVEGSKESPVYCSFRRGEYVAKISDMGLGKQLAGQSSFGVSTLANSSIQGQNNGQDSNMTGAGPGSVGWQAPEVMSLRWSPESIPTRSEGSSGAPDSFTDASPMDGTMSTRTSRSVDIFSLGCIFFCTMVPGSHPFGEWYEREANIMRNKPAIESLEHLSSDAYDLVKAMIDREPKSRPNAKQICDHPFFWKPAQRLAFLCDVSDRLESDAILASNTDGKLPANLASIGLAIERNATQVVGTAWDVRLDEGLNNNVQRFRTYDPSSVRDCLRLIRNKHHHYDELPFEVKARVGSNPEGMLNYFEDRFPRLLMHCYGICREYLTSEDPFSAKYSISQRSRRIDVRLKKIQSVGRVDERCSSKFLEKQIRQLDDDRSLQDKAVDLVPRQAIDVTPVEDVKESETDIQAVISSESLQKVELVPIKMELPVEAPPLPTLVVEEHLQMNEKPAAPVAQVENPQDLVIWEGSTAAKTLNCRGWMRSDDQWIRRTDVTLKKRDANVTRCAGDAKFRTRLCNHWDTTGGTFCSMKRKTKCIFAHGPVELRVKEGKRHRWGKLVDKSGNNANASHSGGEDTYGAARSIETTRKEEGKWNTNKSPQGRGRPKGKVTAPAKKKAIT